ncbi:MAG: FemAB family protein [Syntrophus sp. PtaU1.Bin005]|nr:MAG: FemAB family protein [Syntrophus sp. PtaU1.Bin005]
MILFKFRDRVSAEFAASDETYRDLSPNHFLFWEAIKSAYEGGYKIFDFGRTSPDNKSLMDFKRHWGTTLIDLPQYFYPKRAVETLSNAEDSLSYKLVKKICEKAPDYALKQIGNLCYKHLG